VINPTLIVALFPDVSADATAATVALAPRTSRATAARTIRLFALLAIVISFLLIRLARSERRLLAILEWPDHKTSL
jgi:hypothetical protein